jgi:hypothetical protein
LEPPSPVPECFKTFFASAHFPTCGHPLTDIFRYCHKGAFYNNKDYDDFEKVIISIDYNVMYKMFVTEYDLCSDIHLQFCYNIF